MASLNASLRMAGQALDELNQMDHMSKENTTGMSICGVPAYLALIPTNLALYPHRIAHSTTVLECLG